MRLTKYPLVRDNIICISDNMKLIVQSKISPEALRLHDMAADRVVGGLVALREQTIAAVTKREQIRDTAQQLAAVDKTRAAQQTLVETLRAIQEDPKNIQALDVAGIDLKQLQAIVKPELIGKLLVAQEAKLAKLETEQNVLADAVGDKPYHEVRTQAQLLHKQYRPERLLAEKLELKFKADLVELDAKKKEIEEIRTNQAQLREQQQAQLVTIRTEIERLNDLQAKTQANLDILQTDKTSSAAILAAKDYAQRRIDLIAQAIKEQKTQEQALTEALASNDFAEVQSQVEELELTLMTRVEDYIQELESQARTKGVIISAPVNQAPAAEGENHRSYRNYREFIESLNGRTLPVDNLEALTAMWDQVSAKRPTDINAILRDLGFEPKDHKGRILIADAGNTASITKTVNRNGASSNAIEISLKKALSDLKRGAH